MIAHTNNSDKRGRRHGHILSKTTRHSGTDLVGGTAGTTEIMWHGSTDVRDGTEVTQWY